MRSIFRSSNLLCNILCLFFGWFDMDVKGRHLAQLEDGMLFSIIGNGSTPGIPNQGRLTSCIGRPFCLFFSTIADPVP